MVDMHPLLVRALYATLSRLAKATDFKPIPYKAQLMYGVSRSTVAGRMLMSTKEKR